MGGLAWEAHNHLEHGIPAENQVQAHMYQWLWKSVRSWVGGHLYEDFAGTLACDGFLNSQWLWGHRGHSTRVQAQNEASRVQRSHGRGFTHFQESGTQGLGGGWSYS